MRVRWKSSCAGTVPASGRRAARETYGYGIESVPSQQFEPVFLLSLVNWLPGGE